MRRGEVANVHPPGMRAILAAAILGVACALWAPIAGAADADGARDFMRPPPVRRTPLDELTADGRPTPAAIAVLGAHARGRVVRIQIGGARLEVRDARFDSLGITFAGDPLMDERRDGAAAMPDDSTGLRPGRAPIPWAKVDRLETRRSNTLRGVLIGTFLMTIAGARALNAAGPEPGPGIAIYLVFPPAGALIGGLVGAAIPRWQHEWPPATRPPRPSP